MLCIVVDDCFINTLFVADQMFIQNSPLTIYYTKNSHISFRWS